MPPKKISKKEKSIEEKYQKLTQREHILERPDSYVGSLEICQEKMWIYDETTDKIVERIINYSPAFYKIYDEVLVNAADHSKLHPECNKFEITIDRENCKISVKNNGPGIEVVEHKEHGVYVPTLIFGHLLTGTNFDDANDDRTTGGRNGYGAKLCNIYSSEFNIETFDTTRMLKFSQKFTDNMSVEHEPKITSLKKGSGYTQISFVPDLTRFGLEEITDDIYSLFVKRAYDLAGVCPKITVIIDGNKIKFASFKAYIDKFQLTAELEGMSGASEFSSLIYHDQDRWQVGMFFTPDQNFKQISYVNSICTYHGGTHTNYIVDAIVDAIKGAIEKKEKKIKIRPQTIKDNITIFINSTIVNPAFNTQTKDSLKTTVKNFGSKCELTPKFIKAILASGIVEYVLSAVQQKDQAKIGKITKSKRKGLTDIIKLEDAVKAGGSESELCSLILTEGDSAKALAMAGLSEVNSDYYGVFPLKGKPINVREHSDTTIFKNEEIINICRILGLTPGQPSTAKSRRYGRLILMSDQDTDGFHIKGLLLNFIHYYWPELLDIEGYIQVFNTPIVKARKGKKEISFFNVPDFQKWKETSESGWHIKYYKGLGTSTVAEAKEYFRDLDNLVKSFVPENLDDMTNANKHDKLIMAKKTAKKITKKTKKVKNEDDCNEDEENDNEDDTEEVATEITTKYKNPNTEAITLAFEKSRIPDRKIWVRRPVTESIDYNSSTITIPDFIHKELRLFSRDDCERSIPGIDGLKICQRKIIHVMLKKKLFTLSGELKVGQLANKVSAETDYHHGEKSLCEAIVNLAQDYVGSNNVNLLVPDGQFGSRNKNGKDHASERYTFTRLSELAQLLYKTSDADVLEYLIDDDGKEIEPKIFAPILPPLLFNGSSGIGTGYSADWTSYNPKDIIAIFKAFLNGEEANFDIMPWFKGFTGTILKSNDPGSFLVYGKYQIVDSTTIRIIELPLGGKSSKSNEAYKEFLEKMKQSGKIIDHDSNLKMDPAVFTITMDESELSELRRKKEIYKTFSLISKINTSNMNAHDANGVLRKYNTIEDYANDYYYMRHEMYSKRKAFLAKKLGKELDMLKWKVQFIDHYLDGTIDIANKKKADIISMLEELEYPKFNTGKISNDDDIEEEILVGASYDYVLSMKLWSLTEENINKLRAMLKEKKQELKHIETTSEDEQWLKEIIEFEEAYDRLLVAKPEMKEIISNVPKTKKIKKTKKITKK